MVHLTVSIPLPLSVGSLGCPHKVAKWNFYWPAWLNNQTVSSLVLSSAVWTHSEKEDSLLPFFFFYLFHRLLLGILLIQRLGFN